MATVSIPKGMLDPFYRYKRIVLNIFNVSSKGGRIWITPKEFTLLCKQINRKEEVILGYLKKKIGSNILITKEKIEIGKSFTKEEFDDIIEKYIIKNVLCLECGNPETKIEKGQRICLSCGSIKTI